MKEELKDGVNIVPVNAMDYWWKRAIAAEELLGKIKYEAAQNAPQELSVTLGVITELVKDVEVVKPKRTKQ